MPPLISEEATFRHADDEMTERLNAVATAQMSFGSFQICSFSYNYGLFRDKTYTIATGTGYAVGMVSGRRSIQEICLKEIDG